MKSCKHYIGVACVTGYCPNALRYEDMDSYKDIYGTTRKQRCDRCGYNEGCKDCATPDIDHITTEECQKKHKEGMNNENTV